MLVLFTDFGLEGPYIGQVKMALLKANPQLQIIDLFSDLAAGNIPAAAYLLPAYSEGFPEDSVFLCVVDPGVGGERIPVVVKTQRHWFVGPDNGLFQVLAQRQPIQVWKIDWRPESCSHTFHGRDIFAPVAAELSKGVLPTYLQTCKLSDQPWPDDLDQVAYIDIFGNAITGFRGEKISNRSTIIINELEFVYGRTFQSQDKGQAFWHNNSNNLIELSINQGNCAQELGISIGDKISIMNS